ncbi:MAG: dihydroorotase family protein [Candidatus Tenebribacter burtonii]|nr:dihydroorotase family protein [Candidatus Tenebribacter burtonii]
MKILLKNCKLIEGLKDIIIEDDKIVDIKPCEWSKTFAMVDSFDQVIDIKNKLVIPGMIDAHVHVRDMEQNNKETWETASLAALTGGVTTIIDMPNTIPATTNLKGLNAKREAAKKAKLNYKFHLGATENNLQELEQILKSYSFDIAGIKIFLAGSSSNEVVADESKLKEIFKLAKKYDKVVLVHTELQSCLDKWQQKIAEKTIQNHDILRNRKCAIEGTKLVLELANKIGNKLYICHVSTREEIELIRKAKQKSTNIFCEITPHHLTLEESVLNSVGNFGKVNPPLRTKDDNNALLEAVIDSTIDCVGSDHAPHTIDEKIEDYSIAPSGFPGLETTLPILITEFIERKIPLSRLVELTSTKPAEIFEFKKRGKIEKEFYADLAVIDAEHAFPIIAAKFNSKAKYSPFDGMIGQAKVKFTFVNGNSKLPFGRGDVRYLPDRGVYYDE